MRGQSDAIDPSDMRHPPASHVAPAKPVLATRLSRYDTAFSAGMDIRRREFLGVLGGAAAGWPAAVYAQQPGMPVIGFSAVQRLR